MPLLERIPAQAIILRQHQRPAALVERAKQMLRGTTMNIKETAAALETTRRLLTLDPLHETAHRQRMRLHYALGDRAGALQQYESARELLARELGVEPMSGLTGAVLFPVCD